VSSVKEPAAAGLVRLVGTTLALVLALASATSCGSQLDPSEVAPASTGSLPSVATGGQTPSGSTGASQPGPGTDGAAPSDPGASPASPGSVVPPGGPGTATQTVPGASATPTAPAGPGDHTSPPLGDCSGLRDQTGITDQTITIANASDISGPEPGIFASTQEAVEAFAAFFDATSSICGRQLSVEALDTRTDAGGDQQAAVTACRDAFAAVGSMSAFDSGGASTVQACGLPDLRSGFVTGARNDCTTCFAAQSGTPDTSADVVPRYLARTYPDAVGNAGYLYIDAGPAVENATDEIEAWGRQGVRFGYVQAIDVSEFNYSPFVEQLKSRGVQLVRFLGSADEAVRLRQAMQQADYHPQVFLEDAEAYDAQYVDQGGSAVDGTLVFTDFTPFDEAAHDPELSLYLHWLQVVKPGAVPTFDGLFAWSAARLFAEQAQALGGRLTRAALVQRLRHVDAWTDHGMHAPQRVGDHESGPCWRFLRLAGGHWVPQGGTRYRCGPVTRLH
jgi:ABC-type branched-subunit amino acid transport system substrate-binding protein